MNYQRQDYKNLFRSNLEPFLDMLENKRANSDSDRWQERASRLATCISANPEQYVGPVMPLRNIAIEIIEEIFEDFVREHSLFEESALEFRV
jgi:hypothetical protein